MVEVEEEETAPGVASKIPTTFPFPSIPYPPGLITAAVPPGVIISSGLRSGWAKKYQLLYVTSIEKKFSNIGNWINTCCFWWW